MNHCTRRKLLRSAALFSVLCFYAATAQSQEPGEPGGGIGVPAPPPPATKNSVQFDGTSPNSPAIGKINASGTVTVDAGWTCTKVDLIVQDVATGNKADEASGAPNMNNAWNYSNNIFNSKQQYRVKVTATFTKGGTTESKMVDAFLTVK